MCFCFKKWNAIGPDHFDTPSGRPCHFISRPIGLEAWLHREHVPHMAAYARASSTMTTRPSSRRLAVSTSSHQTSSPARWSGLRDRRRVLRVRCAHPPPYNAHTAGLYHRFGKASGSRSIPVYPELGSSLPAGPMQALHAVAADRATIGSMAGQASRRRVVPCTKDSS